MREEISAAVVFLTRLVKTNHHLDAGQSEQLSNALTEILFEKFRDHWYINEPSKGQAYRCIRVSVTEPCDSVLDAAARRCGLNVHDFKLPPEFTVWVDPDEVTCRFGELRGWFCTIATFKNGAQQNNSHSLDITQALSEDMHSRQAHHSKLRLLMNRRTNATCRTNSMSSGSDSDESTDVPTHQMQTYPQRPRNYTPNYIPQQRYRYGCRPQYNKHSKDQYHWSKA